MMQLQDGMSTNTDYPLGELTPPQGRLNVREFYRGKKVFITGCTGFLGKVVLEKMLRDVSDVGMIYIMVRPKRRIDPMDRIKNEILSSPCFYHLWKIHGGEDKFVEFATKKIRPIQGDMLKENVGLSDADRDFIIKEIDLIINSAASVNFDDPLQDALRINFFKSSFSESVNSNDPVCFETDGRVRPR